MLLAPEEYVSDMEATIKEVSRRMSLANEDRRRLKAHRVVQFGRKQEQKQQKQQQQKEQKHNRVLDGLIDEEQARRSWMMLPELELPAWMGGQARLVVRTTAPGHFGCEQPASRTAPFGSYAEAEAADRASPWYRSRLLPFMNGELTRIAEKHGATVLDVYEPGKQGRHRHIGRLPTHIDCLHYCIPGPLDGWVGLFFDLLASGSSSSKLSSMNSKTKRAERVRTKVKRKSLLEQRIEKKLKAVVVQV